MLFHVHMTETIAHDFPAEKAGAIEATDKAYAQDLQRQGKRLHLWRVAGRCSNVSIFGVESVGELLTLLSPLPLFPFMDIVVPPPAHHPSAIRRAAPERPR